MTRAPGGGAVGDIGRSPVGGDSVGVRQFVPGTGLAFRFGCVLRCGRTTLEGNSGAVYLTEREGSGILDSNQELVFWRFVVSPPSGKL
jgi:hypothetical protein